MKKLLPLLFALLLLFSACRNTTEWEKDGMRAKIVEPLEEYNYLSINWGEPPEIVLKDEIDVFVIGTITNKKEIEVQYTDNGNEFKYCRTVFDFKVDDAIYPNSLKGKSIKISSEISSRFWLSAIKDDAFNEGKKYLFALKADTESPLKILGLADYYIFYPAGNDPVSFMLPTDKSEGKIKYIFNYFTTDKNTNAIVEKYKQTLPKTLDDFKEFLREYFK